MPGPTKTRDELISSFSNKLFSAMLQEIIMDAAIQSHKDVVRSKTACPVCGTRCGSIHAQGDTSKTAGPPTSGPSSSVLQSAPNSPPSTSVAGAGTSTPTIKEKSDGNIYFECTNCQKKIASNRYAPHLSGCLRIGTGSRRGAVRNAAAKNKLGTDADRGGSPFVGSDDGSLSHEHINGNGKGKAKPKTNKKLNGKALDVELNGNHKRPSKGDGSPLKKSKKQKLSATGSETTLVDDATTVKPPVPTAAQTPVKARAKSASPHAPGSPSAASGSQYSGRDSPPASATHSVSSLNAQSPSASLASKGSKSYKISSGKKQSRSTGFARNQTALAEVAAKRKLEEKDEDLDFVDVDGEEQEQDLSDSS